MRLRVLQKTFRDLPHPLARWLNVGRTIETVKVFHQYRESFNVTLFGQPDLDH
jgi:hypothetical protein